MENWEIWVFAVAAFIGSYLIGSVSFSILISRFLVLPDPRTIGSGNAGATNVLRTGNKLAALFTLIGDLLKGFIPVAIVRYANPPVEVVFAAMLGTFLGHLYPVYFDFKGGKGVATALGILIGLNLKLGLSMVGIWVLVVAITRLSSLASIIVALASPAAAFIWMGQSWAVAVGILSILQLYRHRYNIVRLLRREESRIAL